MKIAYTGGGTLGSVIPLLGIYSNIKEDQALWIGTTNGIEKEFIRSSGIHYTSIPSYKLRRYASVRTITEFPHLLQGFFFAKKILSSEHPDLVITAGGFTGVPVCWAARTLGIPYVILQLDIRPGLANKLIASRAEHIILSCEKLLQTFKHDRTSVCGIPLEQSFLETARTISQKKSTIPTILFLGGGTGSSWMNEFVKKYANDILQFSSIVHVQGLKERSVSFVQGKSKGAYTSMYSPDRETMARLYSRASVVVSRAGMGTFAELSRLGKPALIIPMPESHQEDNVAYFEEKQAIIVGDQENEEHLLRSIRRLATDPVLQETLSANISKALPQTPEQCILQVLTRIVHIPHGTKRTRSQSSPRT